jgi:hypothetical protein
MSEAGMEVWMNAAMEVGFEVEVGVEVEVGLGGNRDEDFTGGIQEHAKKFHYHVLAC